LKSVTQDGLVRPVDDCGRTGGPAKRNAVECGLSAHGERHSTHKVLAGLIVSLVVRAAPHGAD